MVFVEKVRAGRDAMLSLEEAVRQAVEECISGGILAGFFREHREEIVEMEIFEFDQKLYNEALKEDDREATTLRNIENIMDTLKLTVEEEMAALKIQKDEWEMYVERLEESCNL